MNFKRPFKKGIRRVANLESTGTIKAQKLLRKMDKEKKNGAKDEQEKQETNVERYSNYPRYGVSG